MENQKTSDQIKSTSSEFQKRHDGRPRGLVALAILHGLFALGIGGKALLVALGWHDSTFGEAVIVLVLGIPLTMLLAVSSLGLWLRKPFGRFAALTAAWLMTVGAATFCIYCAAVYRQIAREDGYMADVFMFGIAAFGLIALVLFIVNGWSIFYLSRAKIRNLFEARTTHDDTTFS